MAHFLEELNDKQRKAAGILEGPLLIVAGAGAGKTKTLTYRITNLIEKGVSPKNILAITFTNKAAREMRERTLAMLAKQNSSFPTQRGGNNIPFISTFHALGVHILKQNAPKLGLPRFFGIVDKSDAKKIVKDILENRGYSTKEIDPGKIVGIISKEKGDSVTVDDYIENAIPSFFTDTVSQVWPEYEKTLKKEQSVDLDDLLLITARLLEDDKQVREYYQNEWKYIHIDEYQDTNNVQYNIAKLLSGHKNICVVGDTDQNIYGWRGANLKNMLHFEKDFPNATVVLLEQNYRSSKTILDCANNVIKKNKYRIEKKLFTENGPGEKIGLFTAFNENHEAQFIAQKVRECIEKGEKPEEIAVLFRANFQSRVLEEMFLREHIPYQMLGTKFFERKEIKDILAYIKAAMNPKSMIDVKRIINVPARGIGPVTIQKIIEGKRNELSPAIQKKIEIFDGILRDIKNEIEKGEKPSKIIKYVMERSGLERALNPKNDEDTERLENMMELVSLALKYDAYENHEGHNAGIEALLSDAALASDQDSLNEEKSGVKLMTVHASKGLEFNVVFISGLEQDLFPHAKRDDGADKEQSEEERRLFYVALTRARKKVYLSYAESRTVFGEQSFNSPSEFIADIGDEYIEPETGYSAQRDGNRKPLLTIEF